MKLLADHVELLLREQQRSNNDEPKQAAVGQVLQRLLTGEVTEHTLPKQAQQVADNLEKLSLQNRIGDDPLDAKNVKETVLKQASHFSLGDIVRWDVKSDPGLILIELMALVYSTIGFQIRNVNDDTLLSMLKLAGIQKRPARPAGIVLQSQLNAGDSLSTNELFQLTEATLPGQTGKLPAIESSALTFQPAWNVCGWKIDEGNTKFAWKVTIPRAFFDKVNPEPWIVFVADQVVDADAWLPASWSIVFEDAKDDTYPLRPSYAYFPRKEESFQTPLHWLAFANSAQRDSKHTPCRAIERWIRLQFDSPVRLGGTKPVNGTLRLSYPKMENGKTPSDPPRLQANCAVWLNVGPAKDKSEPLAFDRQGLWTLPDYQLGGAELNQATKTQWSSKSTQPLRDPNNPKIPDPLFDIITGGLPAETTDEMLQRTPAALRYRGSPASAADWEFFLAECDPLDRVAGVAARGALLPSGAQSTVGVQALLAGVGSPVSAAHLAGWMRDEWITTMAAAVRPLGCSVQLFIPRPIVLTYSLKNDMLRSKLENWSALSIARRAELPLLWIELLKDFRKNGPISSTERLQTFVKSYLDELLKPYGLSLDQLLKQQKPLVESISVDTYLQASLIPICQFEKEAPK